MTPSLCTLMAAYNRWMNTRLYDATAQLPEHQIVEDRGAFFGSLFDTLNHICVADLIWLHRFAQHPGLPELNSQLVAFPVPTSLRQAIASSWSALAEQRSKIDSVIIEFAALVSDEDLAQTLIYGNTAGQKQAKNFGLLLQHFFNHQTHHRGQATTLLFQAGIDVGVTDLNAIIPSQL